jgi:hypothetical protein
MRRDSLQSAQPEKGRDQEESSQTHKRGGNKERGVATDLFRIAEPYSMEEGEETIEKLEESDCHAYESKEKPIGKKGAIVAIGSHSKSDG